jgi:hypothetical protein
MLKSHARTISFLFAAIAATPAVAHAADPVMIHNWQAVDLNIAATLAGFRFAPPDTMGAVGPNHFVELINGAFTVYDKNGNQLQQKSDSQFFNSAGFAGTTGGDVRIQFDASTQRWFASAFTGSATGNQLVLAVSQTNDPTGSWNSVSFTGNTGFADYPTLAVDANAVYLTTNNFTSSTGSFTGVSLFTIPKASLLTAVPTTTGMTSLQNLSQPTYGFTLQVPNDQAPVKVGSKMVAAQFNASQLIVTPINGTGLPGATLGTPITLAVSSAVNPPSAIQPISGITIDALDNRIDGAICQVGNLIYLAHTVSSGGRAAVRWTILNDTTSSVVQEGTISEPGADIFMPDIAANEFGEVVIGYSRSNATAPTGYVSAYAIGGTTSGGVLTFGTPLLMHQGEDQYNAFVTSNVARWGDYSAVTVDPSDHHTFWTVQEYAETRNDLGGGSFQSVWGTQVAALQFVPEPASLAILGLGATMLIQRRRR